MTSEHDTKELSTSDDYRLCSLFDTASRAEDVASGTCCRIWELLSLDDPKPCLKWIVSVTPIIVWAIDGHGVFLYSIGKGLEAIGQQPGEAVGTSVFDRHADNPALLLAVRRVLAGEQFLEEHCINDRYFDIQFIPVRGRNGQLSGAVGVALDVTSCRQVKQLVQSHDQNLQTMIDFSPSKAFMLDKDMKLLFANKRFADFVGRPIDELIGRSIPELCDNYDEVCSNRLSIARTVIDTGEPHSFVDCHRERWFDTHMAPVKDIDGNTSKVAVFTLDITDRVKQEELERNQIAEELHEVVSEMLEKHHADHGALHDTLVGKPLTPREVQVLTAIASGLSTKEIAYKYSVSTKTVESQRLSIMRKLQLFNVADLTKYALREGLISLDF